MLQCCTYETYLWLLVLNVTEFTLPALSLELIKDSQSVKTLWVPPAFLAECFIAICSLIYIPFT